MHGNWKCSNVLFLYPSQQLFIGRLSFRNWFQHLVFLFFFLFVCIAILGDSMGAAFVCSEISVHHIMDIKFLSQEPGRRCWSHTVTWQWKIPANPHLAAEAGICWEAAVKGEVLVQAMQFFLSRHLLQLCLDARQSLGCCLMMLSATGDGACPLLSHGAF